MNPVWDDLNARARGLATHLLRREGLAALARARDLPTLAVALQRAGVITATGPTGAEAGVLELAVRRWGGAVLRTLGRWAGARSAALPLVFEAEDRRSLRALLRGAAARIPAVDRLAGLLPTPALPERALEALSHAPTVSALSALLSTWRHPFAPALARLAGDPAPDLYALEVALGQVAARSASLAARRSGSGALRRAIREGIDLDNGMLALMLATAGDDLPPGDLFLAGGERLGRADWLAAIATRLPALAGRRLAAAMRGTPYAVAFEAGGGDAPRLEATLLGLRIRALTRQVRLAPLEPTTTLWVALRFRAQVMDLQRIIWAVTFDAPRAPLLDQFLTAA